MKFKILIAATLLSLFNISAFSQSRNPAVENEIIIETESGVQTKKFLEMANAQQPPMNVFTLIALFTFISAPFGIYLAVEKHQVSKKTKELQKNVILMSEYQNRNKKKSVSDDLENPEDEDQAA